MKCFSDNSILLLVVVTLRTSTTLAIVDNNVVVVVPLDSIWGRKGVGLGKTNIPKLTYYELLCRAIKPPLA